MNAKAPPQIEQRLNGSLKTEYRADLERDSVPLKIPQEVNLSLSEQWAVIDLLECGEISVEATETGCTVRIQSADTLVCEITLPRH